MTLEEIENAARNAVLGTVGAVRTTIHPVDAARHLVDAEATRAGHRFGASAAAEAKQRAPEIGAATAAGAMQKAGPLLLLLGGMGLLTAILGLAARR